MSHAAPAKPDTRRRFAQAAASYEQAAEVQRTVCAALLARLAAQALSPQILLDAGCGTGYGSRLLTERWPAAELLRLDFAHAMLCSDAGRLAPGLPICGDIEHLPLAEESIDLAWSSLAVQWCDLPRAAAEFHRVLRPSGWLAFATLGPGTFAEIAHAFAGVDQHRHTLDFCTPEAVTAACHAAGFTEVHLSRQDVHAWAPDLKTLLRAIKAVGAHGVAARRAALLGKQAWQTVQQRYETFRTADGLPATYDVIFCLAHRP
jgi:malonyl-CoA O-methyltransferase